MVGVLKVRVGSEWKVAALPSVLTDAEVNTAATTINANIARLNPGLAFNVMSPIYGAVGDNTTDDTAAFNAAITAWIASLRTGVDATLLIPPRTYRITSKITAVQAAAGAVQLIGGTVSAWGATIRLDNGTKGVAVEFSTVGSGNQWRKLSIKGLSIRDGAMWIHSGTSSEFFYNILVDRPYITNARVCPLRLTGIFESEISFPVLDWDPTFTPTTSAQSCIVVDKEVGGAQPSSIDILNPTTRGGYHAVYSPNASDVKVLGGTVLATQCEGAWLTSHMNNLVAGTHFESLWLKDGATGPMAAVRMDGSGSVRDITVLSVDWTEHAPYAGTIKCNRAVQSYVYGVSGATGAIIPGHVSIGPLVFTNNITGALDVIVNGGEAGSSVSMVGIGSPEVYGGVAWSNIIGGRTYGSELATDPAAPAANVGVHYYRDNGAGKTQFCVRFPTGAIQVLATEP